MTDHRPNPTDGARLDEAVRRATPLTRMAKPNRRGLLRAMGVYSNLFVVLVALGIPNGTLRQAAGGALASFDRVVRATSAEVVYAVSSNRACRVDTSSLDLADVTTGGGESVPADSPGVSAPAPAPAPVDSTPVAPPEGTTPMTASESDPVMSPSAFPTYRDLGDR